MNCSASIWKAIALRYQTIVLIYCRYSPKDAHVRKFSALRRTWRNEHTSLIAANSHVLSVGNNAAITTKRCLCNMEKVHHNSKYGNSTCHWQQRALACDSKYG